MIEIDHWLNFLKNRFLTIIFSLAISSVISIRKRTFAKRTFVSDPSGSRTRFRSADSLFVEKWRWRPIKITNISDGKIFDAGTFQLRTECVCCHRITTWIVYFITSTATSVPKVNSRISICQCWMSLYRYYTGTATVNRAWNNNYLL